MGKCLQEGILKHIFGEINIMCAEDAGQLQRSSFRIHDEKMIDGIIYWIQ
jgi:hypothetical protein